MAKRQNRQPRWQQVGGTISVFFLGHCVAHSSLTATQFSHCLLPCNLFLPSTILLPATTSPCPSIDNYQCPLCPSHSHTLPFHPSTLILPLIFYTTTATTTDYTICPTLRAGELVGGTSTHTIPRLTPFAYHVTTSERTNDILPLLTTSYAYHLPHADYATALLLPRY